MTTQKREYEKPSIEVVELKQQSALLNMSRPDYEPTEW